MCSTNTAVQQIDFISWPIAALVPEQPYLKNAA
jgi:hypothetical protein